MKTSISEFIFRKVRVLLDFWAKWAQNELFQVLLGFSSFSSFSALILKNFCRIFFPKSYNLIGLKST